MRLTEKDDRGRYYTVEEKILIANEPVNPTTTWITNNENRRYGSPINKLGQLEDLGEEIGVNNLIAFLKWCVRFRNNFINRSFDDMVAFYKKAMCETEKEKDKNE